MIHSRQFKKNINELKTFAINLAIVSKPSDIILLSGDLGVGKTTFARFFINALFKKMKIHPPTLIKSPTFPIMINYNLKKYEVFHYDFYRIKKINELKELNFFESLERNISIIEWPEIIINELKSKSYYDIKFSFVNEKIREINISHLNKK